jgi:hypothetical protein
MAKQPKAVMLCLNDIDIYRRFDQGRDMLEIDGHTRRPRTIRTEHRIQELAMLMHAKHSQTVSEVAAAAVGISWYLPQISLR